MELKKCYEILEVTESTAKEDVRKSFFKRVMKYHPDKDQSEDAKRKVRELTEAYETIVAPKVKRIENGRVTQVTLDMKNSTLRNSVEQKKADIKSKHGGIYNRIAGWIFGRFTHQKSTIIQDRLDDAMELISDYMYDGEFGDSFTDEDGKLHVIANVTLSRALVGGTVTYRIPGQSKREYTDTINGIFHGKWRPMKHIVVDDQLQFWVVYKIIFPSDISEEEESEIREELLLMQTASFVLPFFSRWAKSHPITVAGAGVVISALGTAAFTLYNKVVHSNSTNTNE